MSAHVLLNLLNKLGKRDKMRGLPSILSLFREFNKFNNTGAQNVRFYLSYEIKTTLIFHLELIMKKKNLGDRFYFY